MSLVQYNNFNQPNLNGLVDINSDNITTNSISTGEIIINGENIVDDVLDNKRKLTKIDYDDLEDVTEIDSDLLLTGSILLDDVIITKEELKYLDDARSNIQAQIDAEADDISSLTTHVTTNENDISSLTTRVTTNENDISALEQKTTKIAYNSISDTTIVDSKLQIQNINHTPGTNYIIENTTNTGSFVFRVRDSVGTVRSISISQFTNLSGINDVGCNKVVMGGTTLRESGSVFSGAVTFNGTNTFGGVTNFNNTMNVSGVTNLTNTLNVSGVTNFNNIVNLNDDLFQYETTFLYKNLIFTTSNVKLVVLGGTEITQQELSYLSGLTNNIQFQINSLESKTNKITYNALTDTTIIDSKLQIQNINHTPGTDYIIENTTNTGSFVFRVRDSAGTVRSITISQFTNLGGINDVGCNKVVMGGTTLRENGSVFSGEVTFNGTNTFGGSIVSNNSVTFNNGLSMITGSLSQQLAAGIVQFSAFSSGTNIFKGSDYFGRINMTSTDPAQNRITQTILSGDTINQHNNMKYTIMRYDSGTGTSTSAILGLVENTSQNQFAFYPSLPAGAFNPLVDNQSRTLLANGTGSQNNNSLVFTCWSSTRVGMKIKTTPSVSTSEIWAGTTNITVNSNTGTSMNNVNSIGFTGGKTVDGNFGNIYTATLLTSISMSDNTETSLSSGLVLPAGTYNISWNITFIIDTAGTGIYYCYGCYSTSTSAFTNNTILTSDYKSNTVPVGNFFSLSGQDFVHFATSTTIYLRALVAHNKGANHVMFHNTFSNLKAIKIC